MLSFEYSGITYTLPDKIVVIKEPEPGLKWMLNTIIEIEGINKLVSNQIDFSFYEDGRNLESYFLFKDFLTMKYISYEKFLKLKAFA